MSPLQPTESMIGKLLVASTTVQDPILSRSVCLVVHHELEQIYGVLLNRPMATPPALEGMLTNTSGGKVSGGKHPESSPAALPSPPQQPRYAETADDHPNQSKHAVVGKTVSEASKTLGAIHFGGPLSGPVVAIHSSSEHAEAQAGRGVYVAAQRELLADLVQKRPANLRLIVGHLGWTVDQLAAERASGLWHVIDATEEDVFAGDQDLWPSVIRRATSSSLANWLGIPDIPCAAEVN